MTKKLPTILVSINYLFSYLFSKDVSSSETPLSTLYNFCIVYQCLYHTSDAGTDQTEVYVDPGSECDWIIKMPPLCWILQREQQVYMILCESHTHTVGYNVLTSEACASYRK